MDEEKEECQLTRSIILKNKDLPKNGRSFGAPGETRTPNQLIRSPEKVRLLRVFSSISPIKYTKSALKRPNSAYSSIVSMGFARKLLAELNDINLVSD